MKRIMRFAGHSDWRIPTVGQNGGRAELETTFDPSAPACGVVAPCVPSAFETACTVGCTVASCSCTGQAYDYWSAITTAGFPGSAWDFNVFHGVTYADSKTFVDLVRAVRGGS